MVIFSLDPHMIEGVRELSGVSFTRMLVSFMRVPPSRPSHLPKAPFSSTIMLGVSISNYEFGREDPNIQSITASIVGCYSFPSRKDATVFRSLDATVRVLTRNP